VVELCTKYEWNRTICCWVIDDLAHLILKERTNFKTVLTIVWHFAGNKHWSNLQYAGYFDVAGEAAVEGSACTRAHLSAESIVIQPADSPKNANGLFRSRLCTLGTHYHPTLDPAVLWTPLNDTSRPIFSDSLNLTPPAPLYLRTLWHYTNAVIVIIINPCSQTTLLKLSVFAYFLFNLVLFFVKIAW